MIIYTYSNFLEQPQFVIFPPQGVIIEKRTVFKISHLKSEKQVVEIISNYMKNYTSNLLIFGFDGKCDQIHLEHFHFLIDQFLKGAYGYNKI